MTNLSKDFVARICLNFSFAFRDELVSRYYTHHKPL